MQLQKVQCKCIEDAIKCNARNCLTFQDDVCFRNYDADFFREALNELPVIGKLYFLGMSVGNEGN